MFFINFLKKPKIAKNNENKKKMHFWYICITVSIFNVISEEFGFFFLFQQRRPLPVQQRRLLLSVPARQQRHSNTSAATDPRSSPSAAEAPSSASSCTGARKTQSPATLGSHCRVPETEKERKRKRKRVAEREADSKTVKEKAKTDLLVAFLGVLQVTKVVNTVSASVSFFQLERNVSVSECFGVPFRGCTVHIYIYIYIYIYSR